MSGGAPSSSRDTFLPSKMSRTWQCSGTNLQGTGLGWRVHRTFLRGLRIASSGPCAIRRGSNCPNKPRRWIRAITAIPHLQAVRPGTDVPITLLQSTHDPNRPVATANASPQSRHSRLHWGTRSMGVGSFRGASLSKLAWRSLMLRPDKRAVTVCGDMLCRQPQRFGYAHRCGGCFRLEQSLSETCTYRGSAALALPPRVNRSPTGFHALSSACRALQEWGNPPSAGFRSCTSR